jgi:hypothetical protein
MAGIAQQITAWSYSRIQTYEECPAKAKFSYIDKIPYKRGPAQIRGDGIHRLAEAHIMGTTPNLEPEHKGLPAEFKKGPLKNYKQEFDLARKAAKDPAVEVFVEQQWGLDKDWNPTSWFGKDTFGRVIVDYGVHYDDFVRLVDHKTGKKYDNHKEQLEPYAIAGFHRFPNAMFIEAEMWYLDHPQTAIPKLTIDFERKDLPKLEKKWSNKIKPLVADKRFPPRPGSACRWCDYAKAKGGPCRF